MSLEKGITSDISSFFFEDIQQNKLWMIETNFKISYRYIEYIYRPMQTTWINTTAAGQL